MNAIGMLAREPWVGRLGWALIHFLWQGTLIAVLYAIARYRVCRPHARYLLACSALLAMTAAPIATFVCDGPSGSVPVKATISHASSAPASEWSTTPLGAAVPAHYSWLDDVMPWLVTAWLAGAAAFWLRLAGGWMFAARLRSTPVRATPPEWQRTLRELSERIRISRPVKLLTSARVDVPTVVGWLRPVILMPVGALAGLPFEHIEALLAHELAHIRRHDYLVNILQSIAEATLFYHPAVWWISNQARNEREECCDDIAVSITGDAMVYAEALACLETSRPALLSPALAASGGSLEHRIARLLGIERPNGPRVYAVTPAIAGALVFFMTAVMLAQSAAPKPTFEVVSIKPSPPEYVGFQSYVRGDRYTALTATLRNLVSYAYGIRDFQIAGGPAWASSVGYNISAKLDAAAGHDQARAMMQTLLADRFGLKFHRVTKDRPGYALVIDKSGPKLVESKKPGPGLGLGKGNLNGRGADMRTLSRELSSQMEAPIADRTGLKALYDFTLVWSPDIQAADVSGPSLFSALKEQLGLRLDAVKNVPVEFFVIDDVNRPSEN